MSAARSAVGRAVLWAPLLLLGATPLAAAAGAGSLPPTLGYTLDDITQAWQAREQRIRAASAEWTETVFHPRGSLIRTAQLGRRGDSAELFPPEDFTATVRCRLLVDGVQSRFEREGNLWSYDRAEFVPRTFVSVFGSREQGQYYSEVPGKHGAVAFVNRSEKSPHAHDLSAFPASFAARPVEPKLRRPRADRWRLEPLEAEALGRSCAVLVHEQARYNGSSAPGTYLVQLWLDPERDFALVQFEEGEDGHVYFHLELEHERHTSGEWLPVRWKTLHFRAVEPFDLTQQTSVAGGSWTLEEPIAANAFQVPRPPRTWVRGEAEGLQYIVRADGSRRRILAEELARGATHWDLLETDEGQAGLTPASAVADQPAQGGFRGPWVLACIALGSVVAAVAWFAVRSGSRPRRVASNE
jgi:hypothetical protein